MQSVLLRQRVNDLQTHIGMHVQIISTMLTKYFQKHESDYGRHANLSLSIRVDLDFTKSTCLIHMRDINGAAKNARMNGEYAIDLETLRAISHLLAKYPDVGQHHEWRVGGEQSSLSKCYTVHAPNEEVAFIKAMAFHRHDIASAYKENLRIFKVSKSSNALRENIMGEMKEYLEARKTNRQD